MFISSFWPITIKISLLKALLRLLEICLVPIQLVHLQITILFQEKCIDATSTKRPFQEHFNPNSRGRFWISLVSFPFSKLTQQLKFVALAVEAKTITWIAWTTVATVSKQKAKTRHCLSQIGQ